MSRLVTLADRIERLGRMTHEARDAAGSLAYTAPELLGQAHRSVVGMLDEIERELETLRGTGEPEPLERKLADLAEAFDTIEIRAQVDGYTAAVAGRCEGGPTIADAVVAVGAALAKSLEHDVASARDRLETIEARAAAARRAAAR